MFERRNGNETKTNDRATNSRLKYFVTHIYIHPHTSTSVVLKKDLFNCFLLSFLSLSLTRLFFCRVPVNPFRLQWYTTLFRLSDPLPIDFLLQIRRIYLDFYVCLIFRFELQANVTFTSPVRLGSRNMLFSFYKSLVQKLNANQIALNFCWDFRKVRLDNLKKTNIDKF